MPPRPTADRGDVLEGFDDDQIRVMRAEGGIGGQARPHPVTDPVPLQCLLDLFEQSAAGAVDLAGGHVLLPHDAPMLVQHGLGHEHHLALADDVVIHVHAPEMGAV